MSKLSKRLENIAKSLPLKNGVRVLEIGCGPGALAREISKLIGAGQILAIDRSANAIGQAMAGSQPEMASGHLSFKVISIENFELEPGEDRFDIAIAIRVGAFDGRHPEIEKQALSKVAKALTKKGKLYIDGENGIREVSLDKFR